MSILIAIVCALFAAIALTYGTLYQHWGVSNSGSTSSGESHRPTTARPLRFLGTLLQNMSWCVGLVIMVVGNLANIVALALAPVIIVQPIGALSLVLSVVLAVRYRKLPLSTRLIFAIIACTTGIAGFVTVSLFVAAQDMLTAHSTLVLAGISAGIAVCLAGVAGMWRKPVQSFFMIGAGVLFGCVAAGAHVVSVRFLTQVRDWELLTLVIAILLATIVGLWFVQIAHATGPPEVVIAGLTVIDPIVAVCIGIFILGEAPRASGMTIVVMGMSGAIASFGVFMLSKYHPEVLARARSPLGKSEAVAAGGS